MLSWLQRVLSRTRLNVCLFSRLHPPFSTVIDNIAQNENIIILFFQINPLFFCQLRPVFNFSLFFKVLMLFIIKIIDTSLKISSLKDMTKQKARNLKSGEFFFNSHLFSKPFLDFFLKNDVFLNIPSFLFKYHIISSAPFLQHGELDSCSIFSKASQRSSRVIDRINSCRFMLLEYYCFIWRKFHFFSYFDSNRGCFLSIISKFFFFSFSSSIFSSDRNLYQYLLLLKLVFSASETESIVLKFDNNKEKRLNQNNT